MSHFWQVTTDNDSFEQSTGSTQQSTHLQAGDVSYSEREKQMAAVTKMAKNGVTEEKQAALQEVSNITVV